MSSPLESEHQPIPEESWSVGQWRAITADWSLFHRTVVKLIAGRPFEDRLRAGGEFFEERFDDKDPASIAFGEFLAMICSMPDRVLARIIKSLPEDVEDVDPIIVIPKQPFKPFENARGFLPANELGSIVLLKLLDFGGELTGSMTTVRVSEDRVVCIACVMCETPQDLRRVRGINLSGEFRDKPLSANFGDEDNSLERRLDLFSRQLDNGGSVIQRFVTGYDGVQRRLVGLPYDLNVLRSDLSFTLQPTSNP